ncbi:MAG: IMPACT family protein [Alicyclobacillus sp.]|nr:IMPACT family protein [Alicyclobacillus sp.]
MPEEPVTVEKVVKKSRFIAFLCPVRTPEEAEAQLRRVRELHREATHNCYAYTAGLGVPVERFSDDGEPAGTAGRPILEVLRRNALSNALVVVTRYFGGTLLGAAGLVRAYSDASAQAVTAASLLSCQPMHPVRVNCDYSLFGKLEHGLAELGYPPRRPRFGSDVEFTVWVPPDQLDRVTANVRDWSGGRAALEAGPAVYVGVRADGTIIEGVC